MQRIVRLLAYIGLSLTPQFVFAENRTFDTSGLFASNATWGSIVDSVFSTLRGTVIYIAAAVFIVGAFYLTLGYKSENQSTGKSMLIASLVGLAIVIGAVAIFNSVYYFTQH